MVSTLHLLIYSTGNNLSLLLVLFKIVFFFQFDYDFRLERQTISCN